MKRNQNDLSHTETTESIFPKNLQEKEKKGKDKALLHDEKEWYKPLIKLQKIISHHSVKQSRIQRMTLKEIMNRSVRRTKQCDNSNSWTVLWRKKQKDSTQLENRGNDGSLVQNYKFQCKKVSDNN